MVANSPMLPRPIPDKGSHRNEDIIILLQLETTSINI